MVSAQPLTKDTPTSHKGHSNLNLKEEIDISIDPAEPLRANWRHVFSDLINVLERLYNRNLFLINATLDLFSADNSG